MTARAGSTLLVAAVVTAAALGCGSPSTQIAPDSGSAGRDGGGSGGGGGTGGGSAGAGGAGGGRGGSGGATDGGSGGDSGSTTTSCKRGIAANTAPGAAFFPAVRWWDNLAARGGAQ